MQTTSKDELAKKREAALALGELESSAPQLDSLREHPGWALLLSEAEKEKQSVFELLAAKLMNSPQPVSHEEVSYWRGYVAGLAHILNHPKLTSSRARMKRDAFERKFPTTPNEGAE